MEKSTLSLNTNVAYQEEKPLCLVYPFELLSHYLRCIDLFKPLAYKYDIKFAYSEQYAHYVAEAGFDTFACKHMDTDKIMQCAQNFDFSWLEYNVLKTHLDDQIQTICTLKPAIVVSDNMPTISMATEHENVPSLAIWNAYMSPHYAGTRDLSIRHEAHQYKQKMPAFAFDLMITLAEK